MKKSIILFSAIVGGAFLFQGCQNVEEEVKKATDAANAACATQLDELNAQLTASADQLALLSGEKDSLLLVLDSLTAPKTAAKKTTTTKKPAATTPPPPADSREAMKQSTTPGVDARQKMKGQ
jgi:hypothetical protein